MDAALGKDASGEHLIVMGRPDVAGSESVDSEHLIRSLADTHLADFDLDEAINALLDIEKTTPADLPDDLLVKAARFYLETMNEPLGGDPSAALRKTLFDV